jgi:O-antigen ligase
MIEHKHPPFYEARAPSQAGVEPPTSLIEYGYYVYLLYTVMGGVFGLQVSNLASVVLTMLLLLCLLQRTTLTIIRLAAFPLACGITYLLIQLFIHNEMLVGPDVRPFILWVFTVVVIQSLALRTDFLHRFALVIFTIGIASLPFLTIYIETGAFQRVGLNRGIGYSHPNEMAEWYGFCTVYFAVSGFVSRRNALRILWWLIAVGCLYVVTLTVSRGALMAVAIAVLVASRHVLKGGFLPLLVLALLTWIIVELGIFEQAAQFYGQRGMEETGRLAVWPLIFESFLGSPYTGVGVSNIGAVAQGRFVTPHNGFLYLAQASGIVPLALFIAYWLRVAWTTLHADAKISSDAAFYMPLLVYAFLTVFGSSNSFMMPWVIVALALPVAGTVRRRTSGGVGRRRRPREKTTLSLTSPTGLQQA